MNRFKPLIEFLVTVAYIGKIRWAPGTWGSLAAVPVIVFLPANAPFVFIVATLLGLALCEPVVRLWKVRDPGWFVLDEFCGMLLAALFFPPSPWIIVIAFALFRFFDIVKPLGIRKLDQIPHSTGIMWDDLLAGLYTSALIGIILKISSAF